MTATDHNSYRLRQVDGPGGPADPMGPAEIDDSDYPGVPAYPGPSYPYNDNSAMAIWSQDSHDHNTQRRLDRLTTYVEGMHDRAHAAYMAQCQRVVERAEADAAVAEALGSRAAAMPAPLPEPARAAEFRAPEDDDEPSAGLQEAADALFAIAPDLGRDKVQRILRCGERTARTLVRKKGER